MREPRRLPEALDAGDVDEFFADLLTYRDRAIVLAMLLGGLRAGEVRSLRLADVDVGLRQVRVIGKGGRERVVPIHRSFFVEVTNYLRHERSTDSAAVECFVVLRGPTTGSAMTEAGMRKIFRTHRERSGAVRVRPHRLRHTYGTDLAAAGMDLLVLRELMGHASPETTAGYVHVSAARIADEYAKALQQMIAEPDIAARGQPARTARSLPQLRRRPRLRAAGQEHPSSRSEAASSTASTTSTLGCCAPPRLACEDARRADAWPFLCWCFASRPTPSRCRSDRRTGSRRSLLDMVSAQPCRRRTRRRRRTSASAGATPGSTKCASPASRSSA